MIDFKNLKINKSKFFHYLKKKYKIILQVHYVPTYKFKLFKKFVKKTDVIKKFPNTEKNYEETFSIPLYIDLSKKKILYICRAIEKTILALKK